MKVSASGTCFDVRVLGQDNLCPSNMPSCESHKHGGFAISVHGAASTVQMKISALLQAMSWRCR